MPPEMSAGMSPMPPGYPWYGPQAVPIPGAGPRDARKRTVRILAVVFSTASVFIGAIMSLLLLAFSALANSNGDGGESAVWLWLATVPISLALTALAFAVAANVTKKPKLSTRFAVTSLSLLFPIFAVCAGGALMWGMGSLMVLPL
jgi:hypothetical protein